MTKFRKPIRIHAQGHFGDLLLTQFGGGCGDLDGDDVIHARFEDEKAGFVISFADIKQAVRALEIEKQWAEEDAIRSSPTSCTDSKGGL